MDSERVGQPAPSLTFNIMKFSFQLFQKPAYKLNEREYYTVKYHAEQELCLHNAILFSEYACGVVVPPSVVERSLKSLISEYKNKADFFDHLAKNSIRLSSYIELLASDLKVEAILARVASHDTQISPGEVKDYYRSNREAFFIPEQRSACHILISTENQYSHLPKNSPLSRIRKIHALLLESPGRFGEQARRYSDCTSSPDGGKLGRVKPDELCPELNQVLFTLREGELSDTIETPLGFHLLYCEKIHPRQPMIFADAYLKIRQLLGREKKLRSCREWIESLLADQ